MKLSTTILRLMFTKNASVLSMPADSRTTCNNIFYFIQHIFYFILILFLKSAPTAAKTQLFLSAQGSNNHHEINALVRYLVPYFSGCFDSHRLSGARKRGLAVQFDCSKLSPDRVRDAIQRTRSRRGNWKVTL